MQRFYDQHSVNKYRPNENKIMKNDENAAMDMTVAFWYLQLLLQPVWHLCVHMMAVRQQLDIISQHCSTVFTARRYASAVLAVIVCLSVCLSVTSRNYTKIAKPRIRLTTPYDSPETLVFRCQKSWQNSHDITSQRGRQIEVG